MSRQGAKRNQKPASPPSGKSGRWPLIVGVGVAVVIVAAIVLAMAGGTSAPAPVASASADVAAGQTLYQANCAVCHGVDLKGTNNGPPFLNVIYAPNHHPDAAFFRAVAQGVTPHHWQFGPMPPITGLSQDEVGKIVAYVRSVQQQAGIVRDPSH